MIKWIEMKRLVYSVIAFLAVLVIIIFPSQTANAHASVKLDYSKTIITLNETVVFKAEVSEISNITWYCDDVAVKSEWATSSNYTFIPKAIGTYLIKLSVDGFTNPPPSGPTQRNQPRSLLECQIEELLRVLQHDLLAHFRLDVALLKLFQPALHADGRPV